MVAHALPDTNDPQYALRRRRAIRSAYAGFFIDSFDIFLPSVALLPAMAYFDSGLSTGAARLVTDFTFAATLLGRPVGAAIFGHFSDRLGRKLTGYISLFGFAVCTLVIGCLPGSEQIGGGLAIGLLIALRFIDGVFLGGEYTAATPMAIEYTRADRRGFIGGCIQSAATWGYALIAVFTYVALKIAPASGLHSGFVQWGWRIPFWAGAVLAVAVCIFMRRKVEDSDIWQETKHIRSPLVDTFAAPKSRVAFFQVFLVMTGIFFGSNMLASLMPQLLVAHQGYSASDLTLTLITCNVIVPGSYIFGGWLSDRIGRKKAMIITGTIMAVVQGTALALIGSMGYSNWGLLTITAFFVAAASVMPIGIMPAWINELFPTKTRSSGWGVGYSSATIIPALFVFYQTGLLGWMPYNYTPAVLAAFGGILVLIGGFVAKETLGTDLSQVKGGDEPAVTSAATEQPAT